VKRPGQRITIISQFELVLKPQYACEQLVGTGPGIFKNSPIASPSEISGEEKWELSNQPPLGPYIPADRRKTADDNNIIAAEFNHIGAEAQKQCVRFAYHNHRYGMMAIFLLFYRKSVL
jgi:hypothetical protein